MMVLDGTRDDEIRRRSRDFTLLWTGNWLQYFGSRMSAVSYPLLALAVSGGSARAAGFVATAAVLPYVVFQLPAGVLVDRWDRKRVMAVSAVGRVVALGAVVALLGLGLLTMPALIVLIFADVSFAVFSALAERASIPSIVLPERLGSAISQNEARGRIAGLIGGPLGTVLFAWARWSPYAVAAAGAAVAALNVLFIRSDCGSGTGRPQRHLVRELADGLRWVRNHAFLRAALPLVSLSGGLLQIVSLALIVVLVKEQGHSASSVGLVLGISGIGGVLGALTANWFMARVPFSMLLIGGFGAWSALAAVMAFVTDPIGLGVLFAAMNAVGAVFGVAAGVYQMMLTSADMQGRVGAIAGLVTAGGSSLGAFAGGFLLDQAGGATSILLAGAGIATVALVATAIPAMQHAGLIDAPPAPAGDIRDEEKEPDKV